MTDKETIAFLTEIANQGFVIYEHPEGYAVRKIATMHNSAEFVREGEVEVYLSRREQVEALVKGIIGWTYEEKTEPVVPVFMQETEDTSDKKWVAFLVYDIGLGVCSEELGSITHYSYEGAKEIAASRARDFFKEVYPREDYEAVRKEVRVRPYQGQ